MEEHNEKNLQEDGKVANIIFWIYAVTVGTLWITNIFSSSRSESVISLRWITFGLEHFGYSLMLILVVTYLIDHRKEKHMTGKILAIVFGIIMLVLQIKNTPIFFKDITYYKDNGFAAITGEATKVTYVSDAFIQNIYMNNDHQTAYGHFFSGGIEKGDEVTLYYLPNSNSIFYYDYFGNIEIKW